MASPCRHTVSGAVVVCVVAAIAAFGSVQAAADTVRATDSAFVAAESCPQTWSPLSLGPRSGDHDGNVSVLVGGNLRVTGSAAGAEGTVVALGDASFARDVPGTYALGATLLGSQVTPYAGSDMLAVGGDLTTALGTHVDVGAGLGGDVVVGGAADGLDLGSNGGTVDPAVADATAPYLDLAGRLAPMSVQYAALPPTGTVDVTDTAITLTGDGAAATQVFQVDGATLGTLDPSPLGRSLQLVGVPSGATVVVNLTGPVVDLDVDTLLAADGTVVNPLVDASFADLTTHLLWNAPNATSVDIGGLAQLPGSLLVPTAPSTTTLSGVGTNGRILVAGDLVHTGLGELHAYPFLPEPQLTCAPDLVHLTSLSLDVELVDPDHVVDRNHYFEGSFGCSLAGQDVTPVDNTWRLRATAESRVLSDQIPAGAVCNVTESLSQPAPFRSWAPIALSPDSVVVAKRRNLGFTLVNRVREVSQPPVGPTSTPTPTPTAAPTDTPTEATSESALPQPDPTQSPTGSLVEPTNGPALPATPSAIPTSQPEPSGQATTDASVPQADTPHEDGTAGPLIATTPLNLRGAFVWGPMLMLSLLTLLLRVRRRPKRLH